MSPAGHCPHHEAAETFNTVVRNWLDYQDLIKCSGPKSDIASDLLVKDLDSPGKSALLQSLSESTSVRLVDDTAPQCWYERLLTQIVR